MLENPIPNASFAARTLTWRQRGKNNTICPGQLFNTHKVSCLPSQLKYLMLGALQPSRKRAVFGGNYWKIFVCESGSDCPKRILNEKFNFRLAEVKI